MPDYCEAYHARFQFQWGCYAESVLHEILYWNVIIGKAGLIFMSDCARSWIFYSDILNFPSICIRWYIEFIFDFILFNSIPKISEIIIILFKFIWLFLRQNLHLRIESDMNESVQFYDYKMCSKLRFYIDDKKI